MKVRGRSNSFSISDVRINSDSVRIRVDDERNLEFWLELDLTVDEISNWIEVAKTQKEEGFEQ